MAFSAGCQSGSVDESSDEPSSAESAIETSLSIAEIVGERVEKSLFIGGEQAQVPAGATCRAGAKVAVAIGTLRLVNPTAKAAAVTLKKKAGDERPIQLRYYATAPQLDKLEDCASTAANSLSAATRSQVVVPPNGEVVVVGYFITEGNYPLQKTGSVPLEITTDALDDDASLGLTLAANVGERVARSVFVGPGQSQIPKSPTCRAGSEKISTTVGILKLFNPTATVASVSLKKTSTDDQRIQLRVYASAPQAESECLASSTNELSKATDSQVVVPPNGEAYVVAHFVTDGDYPTQGTGAIPLEVSTDSLE